MSTERQHYTCRDNLIRTPYQHVFYNEYEYSKLAVGTTSKSYKSYDKRTYSDFIIMADTETSKLFNNQTYQEKYLSAAGCYKKRTKYHPVPNKVILWTLSINYDGLDVVTLYGRRPSEIADCLSRLKSAIPGDILTIYIHYLGYDWVFLRKFLFRKFGYPVKQLNTKPQYPVSIEFQNGIILKDSLILAQRGLDKWAHDLRCTHQKKIGDWDYTTLRTQTSPISDTELGYAEGDTLAGVECLHKTFLALGKNNATIPLTATGIPRSDIKRLAKNAHYKDVFTKIAPTYEQYLMLTDTFHGGYVHGNRHYINNIIDEDVRCYDFSSSYPYVMLAEKMPCGEFMPYDADIQEILDTSDTWAYFFKLTLIRPCIKTDEIVMPYLQYSKCVAMLNPKSDNGRILTCDYAEIYITEHDLSIIYDQYDGEYIINECHRAYKDYLPRWFRDYVYEKYKNKTMMKGGDAVLYSIEKSKANCLYGLTAQKSIQANILEDYTDGTYYKDANYDPVAEYDKYLAKKGSVLPYQWGVWVTATATRNLYRLGALAGVWIYSDTDSVYGIDWNVDAVASFNRDVIQKIKAAGYDGVQHKGKIYYPGVAEHDDNDDTYTSFCVQGAKRYAGVKRSDGEIHITVAGVPKERGRHCLKSMEEFKPGFIFRGIDTKKETHSYLIHEIYTDDVGDEVADSIDLTPCDYELDSIDVWDFGELNDENQQIEIYGGELLH